MIYLNFLNLNMYENEQNIKIRIGLKIWGGV